MRQARILRLVLTIGYRFVVLLGMLPVRYNSATQQFYSSSWTCAYSMAVFVSFSYFYLTSAVSALKALNPMVAFVFVYLTHTVIAVTVLLQCCAHRRLCRWLNDAHRFAVATAAAASPAGTTIDADRIRIAGALRHLFVKTVLVPAVAQCALIRAMGTLILQLTGAPDYMAVVAMSLGYFMQTLVPNAFCAAQLACDVCLQRLGAAVEQRIASAQRAQRSKRSVQRRIAVELDQLAAQWLRLAQLAQRATQLHQWQLLCSALNFYGILVLELFLAYVFVAEAVLAEAAVDWPFVTTVLLYNAAIFAELHQLCAICTRVRLQADRMASRVHSCAFLMRVDGQLARSVMDASPDSDRTGT